MSEGRDDEYEFELMAGRAEIAAVLGGVVEGLHAGSVQMSDGTEAVTVDVPEELELEVELELEDGEASLELELTWPTDGGPSAVPHDEETQEERQGISAASPLEGETEAEGESPEKPRPLARFELFRDRAEEWRWRLRHRNGNVIATGGEGYTRKHNAVKGLRSVVRNAPNADVTEGSSD
jgi:amphi-Trp domain-containing protein